VHAILDIVLPVFGVILLGYWAGRVRVLGEKSSEALNLFVYYFAMPPLLFRSTAAAPVAEILNGRFILVYFLGTIVALGVTLVGSRLLFGVRDAPGMTIHGLLGTFSNTGYMGIPLFVAAFGADRALPAVVITMFVSIVSIGSAILVLENSVQRERRAGGVMGDLARTLFRNPILVAPFLGLLWALTGIPLPSPATHFLDLIGSAAAPAALFAIGLSLVGRSYAGEIREVAWLSAVKLLVHPAATWLLIAYLIPLDPFWAKSAVILAALPAGALVYVVSQRFNVRVATGTATIVASTAAAVVTLSALLLWLGVK
jgi:predicted permease